MRTRLFYALSALMMMATLLVVSCSKGGDEPTPTPTPNPPITIPAEFKNLSFESDALSKEVKFTATTDWNVTLEETTKAAPSWLKVSPMSGKAGKVTLKINIEKNTSEKERSSIVKLNAGGEHYTITLIQKAGKAEVVAVTGVSLNKSTLSLEAGENETLTATVNPSNAANKDVTWKSSDDKVATVVNGKVTAVKAGSATITVTTEDGSKTATCKVTVAAEAVETVAVTGVTLSPTTLSFVAGETVTLTATVNPTNATNKDVTWKSDKTAVATVDANGKVTAKTAGTATITVTTADGAKTATCKVTVTAKVLDPDGSGLDDFTNVEL